MVQELLTGKPSQPDLAPEIRQRILSAAVTSHLVIKHNAAPARPPPSRSFLASLTNNNPSLDRIGSLSPPPNSIDEQVYRRTQSSSLRNLRVPRSASASGYRTLPISSQPLNLTSNSSSSGIGGGSNGGGRSSSRPSSRDRAVEAEQMKERARAVLKKRGSYINSPDYFLSSSWEGGGGGC